MYSSMCVKIALCLALIVSIDGYVLKDRQVPLSPEGMTVEITVKNKGDKHPVSIMKIDIDEQDKKVMISMAESPSGVLQHHLELHPAVVPTLENRNGIRVGGCAHGYIPKGELCIDENLIKDDEDE